MHATDALPIVILRQLLTADDYDSIEAVKAAAKDYLDSQNPCPLDFAHQPHDHCDGTAASTRHTSPVNNVNPVPIFTPETFDAHGHTWTRHTPGDPCPVGPSTLVWTLDDKGAIGPFTADSFSWHANRYLAHGSNIIGWRLARWAPSLPLTSSPSPATPPAASPAAPPHPPGSADDTPRSSAPESAPPAP